MTQATEVLFPTSADEAVAQFGDGSGVTVIGGGTIVMPEITYGRLAPAKALLLARGGWTRWPSTGRRSRSARRFRSGGSPSSPTTSRRWPGARVVSRTTRSAGRWTVGGNLCAGEGHDAPRGDLQGPFLALDAEARSVGAGGARTEPLEDFLAHRGGRLLLDLRFEKPAASAFSAIDYPHTHEYTVLAVTGVRTVGGETRLAATGLAGYGARMRSAEAAASDPEQAGAAAVKDVRFGDDALASAWYRERTLPVLVRSVLSELEEAA